MDPLIDPPALAQLLGTGDLVLLDVRWALGDPNGREHHRREHLPGAVFVDLDAELAGPPSAAHGRHPLPAVADLQRSARRWGVTGSSLVVAYDDTGALAAARAWWLLRWAGHDRVRILDGGLPVWREAGLPVESGDVAPAPGDVVLTGSRLPGAVSAPTAANLNADGRFRSATTLRERFAELGVRPGTQVAVYCGSGITASHEIAALALAGIDAALYPGSWSQWSNNPARPVGTDSRPAADRAS